MSNITTRNSGVSAWGNLDQSNFDVPRVVIAQRTSRKGTPGRFVYNNGKEVEVFRSCVLIKPNKARVLYGPTFDSPSLCGSTDWNVPSQRYTTPISQSCHHCLLSQWDNQMSLEDVAGKRAWEKKLNRRESKAPVCTEVQQLLMLDKAEEPFLITFSKTQLAVVDKQLNSRLRTGFGVPWGATFDMGIKMQESPQGVWYNVAFANFMQVPEEKLHVYAQYAMRFNDVHDRLDEEHEREDKQKVESLNQIPEGWDSDFDQT